MQIMCQICVTMLKLINVRKGIYVHWPIIELKDFTTLKSIRPSFVLSSLSSLRTANMESTAHLPTQQEILKLELSTSCRKTLTSTCSTSRQSGVHSTKSTTKHNVTMPTTGKISEESQVSLTITLLTSVRIGKQAPSSVNMKKVASYKQVAQSAMGGKSKSTTHWFIRQSLARRKSVMHLMSVLTITLRAIRGSSHRVILCR